MYVSSPKELRFAGDIAHIPDLCDGEIFDDLTAGAPKHDVLDIPEICRPLSEAPGGQLHRYPGSGHLFANPLQLE